MSAWPMAPFVLYAMALLCKSGGHLVLKQAESLFRMMSTESGFNFSEHMVSGDQSFQTGMIKLPEIRLPVRLLVRD